MMVDIRRMKAITAGTLENLLFNVGLNQNLISLENESIFVEIFSCFNNLN
jgi:hypothetical protein